MSDKKQSEEFLQGFACGWCLVIDMMRAKGMEELPHPAGQGMVAFADASEAYFTSSGLGKLLGPYHTQEFREVLLKNMLATRHPASTGEETK
jgi:hypothetical protein